MNFLPFAVLVNISYFLLQLLFLEIIINVSEGDKLCISWHLWAYVDICGLMWTFVAFRGAFPDTALQ